jgi:hypothetical protein
MQGIGRCSVLPVRKQADNTADSVARDRLRLVQMRRIVTAIKDYSYHCKGKREMADLNMTPETALVVTATSGKALGGDPPRI